MAPELLTISCRPYLSQNEQVRHGNTFKWGGLRFQELGQLHHCICTKRVARFVGDS